jgi:hypothetical protein
MCIAVYAQLEKFLSFSAIEMFRHMNSSIIPRLKMLLNKLISCSVERHLIMFVVQTAEKERYY